MNKEIYNFVLAYSGGKDCTLVLDKMISMGHNPICLIVCMDGKEDTHMHHNNVDIFEKYEQALGIPIIAYATYDKHNEHALINALKVAKEMGADTICTGDIDLEEIRDWNQKVADEANLKLVCPLWKMDRKKCLDEIIERGYKAIITVVLEKNVPETFLGKEINYSTIEELKKYDTDICGENGEYHTMVIDGPIFKQPIDLKPKGIKEVEDVKALIF